MYLLSIVFVSFILKIAMLSKWSINDYAPMCVCVFVFVSPSQSFGSFDWDGFESEVCMCVFECM